MLRTLRFSVLSRRFFMSSFPFDDQSQAGLSRSDRAKGETIIYGRHEWIHWRELLYLELLSNYERKLLAVNALYWFKSYRHATNQRVSRIQLSRYALVNKWKSRLSQQSTMLLSTANGFRKHLHLRTAFGMPKDSTVAALNYSFYLWLFISVSGSFLRLRAG